MIKNWALYFLILLVAVSAAYSNCLQNEFLWDDEFLIEKNSYLRSFEHLPKMLISSSTAGFGGSDNFYRPTQNIYYLFIYQSFGYNKVAFHIGNIFLHLLNAWLLFLVLMRLLKNQRWAFYASLLWAVHPTHVEAITYISGTADPLGLVFFLAGLWILPFENLREKWKPYLGAYFFFALSILSKEAMIVIPALILITLAFASPQKRWHLRTYLPSLPLWISAFAYLGLRKTILNFDQTYSFYKTSNIYTENILYRAYTFLATLPEYLIILFRPTHLHMERKFPVFTNFTSTPVLLGTTIVIASLGLGLFCYFKQKKDWPIYCWLWFFGSFVPMMGILVPVNSFILEHWLYLTSIGLFVAFTGLVLFLTNSSNEKKRQRISGALIALLCVGLIYFTRERNKDWRTPITFYSNILQYSQGSARVHNNLAMAFAQNKNWEKAITHYLQAIQTSDSYAQTHYNLARAYIELRQYSDAMTHINRSLEINPRFRFSIELKKQLVDFLNNKSN